MPMFGKAIRLIKLRLILNVFMTNNNVTHVD